MTKDTECKVIGFDSQSTLCSCSNTFTDSTATTSRVYSIVLEAETPLQTMFYPDPFLVPAKAYSSAIVFGVLMSFLLVLVFFSCGKVLYQHVSKTLGPSKTIGKCNK